MHIRALGNASILLVSREAKRTAMFPASRRRSQSDRTRGLAMSFADRTDIQKLGPVVRSWQILLQKSFCFTEHRFSGPYARRSNNHLRDYIIQRELTGDFGNGLEATSF